MTRGSSSQRHGVVAATLVAGALLLGACTASAGSNPPPTTTSGASSTTSTAAKSTSTTRATSTLPPAPAAKFVTIDGKRIRVPTETRSFPIKANSDKGQQVIVEARSFVPYTLYASSGTIVFTNLTTTTQRITFVNYPTPADPLVTAPIPPGGVFRLHHSGDLALKYSGSNGASAYLNIATIPGL